MTCEVPGCDRQAQARGLCMLHYQRARRGTPLDIPLRATTNGRIRDLTEAAISYAHAETEGEHAAAYQRLVRAALRFQRLPREAR